MARADFRERARRPAFLVTLAAAAGLAYTVHAGVWTVLVGGRAPTAGPATTGMLVAVVTSLFLSLAAFYLVRGTVGRDVRTGVGPVLAATPASRLQYAAAKAASNAAVLGAMLLVLAGLAAAIEATRAGGISARGAWRVIAPALLITGPALAAVAGVAVVFDSVPWLRGALGNAGYFFLWAGMLTFGGFDAGSAWLDLTGANLVFEALYEGLRAAEPGAAAQGLTITLHSIAGEDAARFSWPGVEWTAAHLGRRLWWVAVGAGLSVVAVVPLRLFDPFGDRGVLGGGATGDGRSVGSGAPGTHARDPEPGASDRPGTGSGSRTADPPHSGVPSPSGGAFGGDSVTAADLPAPGTAGTAAALLRMTVGELRLLLSGRAWWWYVGLAASNAAALLVGPDALSIPLLAAWLFPLPLWSELGCRERLRGTEPLLFSGPGPRARQLPAQLAAGVVISLLAAVGPLARMATGGSASALAAVGVGALFIPALALALGAWTGREKAFQAIYLVLWYVGPANGVSGLDFMGVTGRATEAGATPAFATAAAGLALLAWLGRGRRLRKIG